MSSSNLPRNLKLTKIPSGRFRMGSSDEWDEIPIHKVSIDSFEMSLNEITNTQYCMFLNDIYKKNKIEIDNNIVYGTDNGFEFIELSVSPFRESNCWILFKENQFTAGYIYRNWPVVFVTWYGAKSFAQHYGLDLPTEAEWEYAARGGQQFEFGTNNGKIEEGANYYDLYVEEAADRLFAGKEFYKEGIEETDDEELYVEALEILDEGNIGAPINVGSFPHNPFMLFDMCGNVKEWCNDWYDEKYYKISPEHNPLGPKNGKYRVNRGESWKDLIIGVSKRSHNMPDFRSNDLGFRVVRRI